MIYELENKFNNNHFIDKNKKLFNVHLLNIEKYLIDDEYWEKLNYSESFMSRL